MKGWFDLSKISKTLGFKKSGFCCKSHCTFHHEAHKQLSGHGRRGTFGLGGGGEGGTFLPEKIHNARILEFCNRDTKALISYEKEKRLPF